MAKETDKTPETDAHPLDGGGMNTGVAVVGFVLCFVAGAGLMWGYDTHRMEKGGITAEAGGTAAAPKWDDSGSPIPIDSNDPVWGSRTAPVTIVQFSDFQCPYCSKVEATMDTIKKAYGADKVRIVWKNRPLGMHPQAKPAAEAAATVFAIKGNDAFWKFHGLAFQNQRELSDSSYEKWASQAGLAQADMAKFKAALGQHKYQDKVAKDDALADKLNAGGTPAFFINGVRLPGAVPFEKFKQIIDAELAKAQAKIARDKIPSDKIYVAMSTENFKTAPKEEEEEGEKEDTKTVWKVPVGKSPSTWSDKALVTIIEFSDFQCPFCKRVEPTLKQIHDTYGDKVRLVWKHEPLPFHNRAEPAAQFTLEAMAQKGTKGFWDAHAKLFENQGKLEDADLEKYAGELGLSVDKVKAAIKEHKYKALIDADQDVAEDFQAQGTPHFFVNGRRIVGAQPFEKFKPIIEEEIARANDLLGKGVKHAELYDALVKDGKSPPPPEKKEVPLAPNAPTKGNANAKVTMQIFSDFQCPFCSRAEEIVNEVMKAYGDKIKVQWRNLPLPMHPDAPLAAEASMEAYKQKGSDGFWKMHGLLFQNQKTEGGLKREALEKYAAQIGLNVEKFKAALDSRTHQSAVEADKKAGNDAGITGTPAFVINGYYISGAVPFPKFRKVIDRALAEAK